MPREGSGHVADNAVEAGQNLTHGAPEGKEDPVSSGVDRSGKAAAPPEYEAGEGLEREDGSKIASGDGNSVSGSGKGPLKSTVDEVAEKAK